MMEMMIPYMPKVTIFNATLAISKNRYWLIKTDQTTVVGHGAMQDKDISST